MTETAGFSDAGLHLPYDHDDLVRHFGPNNRTRWKIALLSGGFVIVGRTTVFGPWLQIERACVVREWGTQHGLGEIAIDGPTKRTILDPLGCMRAPLSSLIGLIDCTDSAWDT